MVVNFLFDSVIPHIDKNNFKKTVKKIIPVILRDEKVVCGTINIRFCSDDEIKIYNKKYLSHDYETDILTFYYGNNENSIDSDILISVDTVTKNSKRFKTETENELLRVVIHGILHLCGYEDYDKAQKNLMKKKENFYLEKLKV